MPEVLGLLGSNPQTLCVTLLLLPADPADRVFPCREVGVPLAPLRRVWQAFYLILPPVPQLTL
jgi:hypothetical protein